MAWNFTNSAKHIISLIGGSTADAGLAAFFVRLKSHSYHW